MKTGGRILACVAAAVALSAATAGRAETTNSGRMAIDLGAVLRLAGARNLDIQIARERLREAQANHASAVEQFFPWISPGLGWHRRDGVAQAVPAGVISDAHFQSYSPGATLAAQLSIGEAIYNSLATRQTVQASSHAVAAQRDASILAAAQAYFDLAKARALAQAAAQAMDVARNYQEQVRNAVTAGIAFQGDALRVQAQAEHYAITLQQALEQERVAGVALAQLLHLDPQVELIAEETELAPISLIKTNTPVGVLVARALQSRPDLKRSQALLAAARATRNGAVYGPVWPSLTAQAFGGGLGGGPDGGPEHFAAEGDYLVGLSWRIGPGGLFDSGRVQANSSALAAAELTDAKLKDTVMAEVVAGAARLRSTFAQIGLARRTLETTTEVLRLTHDRKQFGVGAVAEDLDALKALDQARADYFTAVAEFDKAEFALNEAVGNPGDGIELPSKTPDGTTPP